MSCPAILRVLGVALLGTLWAQEQITRFEADTQMPALTVAGGQTCRWYLAGHDVQVPSLVVGEAAGGAFILHGPGTLRLADERTWIAAAATAATPATLQVCDGAQLLVPSRFGVILARATGTQARLVVEGDGTTLQAANLFASDRGQEPNGIATMVVRDRGRIHLQGAPDNIFITSAGGRPSTLCLESGGLFEAPDRSVLVGHGEGGQGLVVVDGAQSLLRAGIIYVGGTGGRSSIRLQGGMVQVDRYISTTGGEGVISGFGEIRGTDPQAMVIDNYGCIHPMADGVGRSLNVRGGILLRGGSSLRFTLARFAPLRLLSPEDSSLRPRLQCAPSSRLQVEISSAMPVGESIDLVIADIGGLSVTPPHHLPTLELVGPAAAGHAGQLTLVRPTPQTLALRLTVTLSPLP